MYLISKNAGDFGKPECQSRAQGTGFVSGPPLPRKKWFSCRVLIFRRLLTPLVILFLLLGHGEVRAANRLANEKSPYLLKHADNPVNWYPWSEEAFDAARTLDKPILLSVGYFSCHWCNVMEKESFSDPDLAALLNDVFIAIKVDREERPDIDRLAMDACQMLSNSCGWPLTIFMTPARKPFYAGAYFPREPRFGLHGLRELAERIRDLWQNDRARLLESAAKIDQDLAARTVRAPEASLDILLFARSGFQQLSFRFDKEYGGFGKSTKFPRPTSLFFLLRYYQRAEEKFARDMVEKSMTAMARGGICDHIGGGFHRYTTDREWRFPHFEKMLYDQALLLLAYTEVFQMTGKKEYEKTAREICRYVRKEMTLAQGAFATSESADSQGEEGKFYLWTIDEMRAVLGADAPMAIRYFQVTEKGNFRDPATGDETGKNVLFVNSEPAPEHMAVIREKLQEARQKRVRPAKDDKVLTDWNGLMIAALSRAGLVFSEPSYIKAAARSADFLLTHLRDKDGNLLHRWRDNEAGIDAGHNDYAALIWGLIELYEATFDLRYLGEALTLTERANSLFWNPGKNVFMSYRNAADPAVAQRSETEDRILPSDNGITLLNLLRLSRLTGNTKLGERAQQLAQGVAGAVQQHPAASSMLLTAMDFARGPTQEIVIVGNKSGTDTKKMLTALRSRFLPNAIVVFRNAEQTDPTLAKLIPYVQYMSAINKRATAYVCADYQCRFPTNDIKKMHELLDATLKRQEENSGK